MPYYHAVMFDFDGTLVDTMHEYARIAGKEITALFGLPEEHAQQLYLETSGVPFFQQLEIIFGPDLRNAECASRFEQTKAAYLEGVTLDAKTKRILTEIRSLGLSIAITSNNFQERLDPFIEREAQLFDLVLGFSSRMSKGPAQFSRVIETFGVDRRRLVFVGDSLSDARKALAFGVDFIALAGTLEKSSFTSLFPFILVLDDLSEVLDILKMEGPIQYKAR